MKNQLIILVVGIVAGLALGIGGSYLIRDRYVIIPEQDHTLQTKMDRWTGTTWVMRWYKEGKNVSPYWEPVKQ